MKAIADYGSLIKNDFNNFKTEETAVGENKDGSAPTSQTSELMLGRLLEKIELGISHVRALQKPG